MLCNKIHMSKYIHIYMYVCMSISTFIIYIYLSLIYLSIYLFLGVHSSEVAKLHSLFHGANSSLAHAWQVCFMYICMHF